MRARTGAIKRALVPVALGFLAVTAFAYADGSPAGAAHTMPAADSTALSWSRLADRVPTPTLRWTACQKIAQCATAELPLNYQRPRGAKVKLALLRIRALDPRERVGTLFVNPGGPGDSARAFALEIPQVIPKTFLDRFDIVGVDPRGAGGSTPLSCFRTRAAQARAEAPFAATPFPYTPAQEHAWVHAAQALGRACSSVGQPVASAMDETNDALDLDVLRRAVGDTKLTYFGESGGSYLGQLYANMFPGRVRADAIDGIIDPQGYVGTPATAGVPAFIRIGAAAASYRALHELLVLCQRAGPSKCSFASVNTPARYAGVAARLLAHPLSLAAPGIKTVTFTYANLISDTEHWLHAPAGYHGLFGELTHLARLTGPGGGGASHDALVRGLLHLHAEVAAPSPYANLAFPGIACTDGLDAASAASWPAAAAAADRQAPYFGAYYAWLSVACAHGTWTAHDTDLYRGPFNHRTDAPVLVIGARWDPATSYTSAVKVARMLPNSRFVASDNWGHQSGGTSACVDHALWSYLISPRAPMPKVTHCRGNVQPFAPSPSTH